MSINRVIISGNLTRDPELRSTAGGTSVLGFGVAVNDRRKNQQTGEWEDYPNFIDCTMFGARADAVLTSILNTELTPELVPTVAGAKPQSTQDSIGPYNLQDFTLYYVLRHGMSMELPRSPVSDYAGPFAFTGKLVKVTVTMRVEDARERADG